MTARGSRADRLTPVVTWLYGLYAAGLGGTLLLLGGALLLLVCRTQRSAWHWSHRYVRFVFRILGLRPIRSGKAVPRGTAILVSNHSSYLDGPLLIAALERPIVLTPKLEVFSWPLLGRIARRLGFLPVDRATGESRHRSLVAIEAALEAGQTVHLFPEGTFTAAAGMLPFHGGAFELAARVHARVVPVAIIGAREALPAGWHLPRKRRVEVRVLEPIEPSGDADAESIAGLRETVRQRLECAVGEFVPATLP